MGCLTCAVREELEEQRGPAMVETPHCHLLSPQLGMADSGVIYPLGCPVLQWPWEWGLHGNLFTNLHPSSLLLLAPDPSGGDSSGCPATWSLAMTV